MFLGMTAAALLFLCQHLAAPGWLAPFPGAQPEETRSEASVRTHYATAAKPAEVIAHYQKLLAGAGLPASANADGLGTSLRAAAPECDVLIQIRESGGGTLVRTACSARVAASNALPPVTGVAPSRRLPGADGRAAARAMLEAQDRRGSETMRKYDRPVYPPHKQLDIWDESTTPPLEWPAWLVHMPGASRGLTVTERVDKNDKRPFLHSSFTTNAPMTEIQEFYRALFTANGVPPPVERLSTGQTLSGVVQNASGAVEANQYVRGNHGAHVQLKASFHRRYLNAPITVTLTAKPHPDFKNRR